MCLTLSNAATVLDHLSSVPPARAYTRTLHHAGHLSPGDLWCAVDGEYPRTAILVHRHHDRITLTDQYGATFAYPAAAVIPTAVPDALPLRDRTRTVHLPTPVERQHDLTRPTGPRGWMSLVPCSGWRGPPMCRGPLVSSAPPPSRTVTTPVKFGASPLQVGHRPSSAHPTCVAHVAKTHSPSRTFRGDFAGPGVRRTGSRTGRGRSAHHPVPDRERWVADAQVAWVVEVPRGTRRIRVTREEIRTRASRRGCPRRGLTDVGATQTPIRDAAATPARPPDPVPGRS